MVSQLPPEVWSLIIKHMEDTSKIDYYNPRKRALFHRPGYTLTRNYVAVAWLFCTGCYLFGKPTMKHFHINVNKDCVRRVYIYYDKLVIDKFKSK